MSLLPEVREELVATAARRAAARAPRWRARVSGGTVAVALGVACAVAVAVVGVVALRHHAQAPSGGGAEASTGSAPAAFEAKLAVLRRRQTPADRTYAQYIAPGRVGPDLIAGLTRLAATIRTPRDGVVRVYIVVRRLPVEIQKSPASSSPGDFVSVESFSRRGVPQGGTPVLTPGQIVPSAVGTGRIGRPMRGDPNDGVDVGVVPDGVARVRWTFSGAGYGVLHPRPVTVFPVVRSNIALAPVAPGQGPLAGAVWYGADDRVIASSGPGANGIAQRQLINSVNASRNRPIAPVLIAHYALFRTVPPEDLARDHVLPTAGSGNDLNYWETRYIGSVTGLDGRGLWITPGTRSLCMMDWNAGDCGSLKGISTGFIGGSTSNGPETTFEGLVPDGNPTVTLVLADGTRKTVPAIDNVYEATVKGRVVAIIDRDIHGRVVRTTLQ